MEEDELKENRFKVSCCRSYLTPKGRCYACPESEDESENEPEESEMRKDPDEEQW